MTVFINNKSTKFCKTTLRIKMFIHKRKGYLFLRHGADDATATAADAAEFARLNGLTTIYRSFSATSISNFRW